MGIHQVKKTKSSTPGVQRSGAPDLAAPGQGGCAPIKRFKDARFEHDGLITPAELAALIQRDLAFDQLDERIKWFSE
jgi:hypothetical protein